MCDAKYTQFNNNDCYNFGENTITMEPEEKCMITELAYYTIFFIPCDNNKWDKKEIHMIWDMHAKH